MLFTNRMFYTPVFVSTVVVVVASVVVTSFVAVVVFILLFIPANSLGLM